MSRELEAEIAQLRARCQAAESALRLVLASYDFHATEDEDLCHQLREPMDAARQVLERASAPTTAWAPSQGGSLPHTELHTGRRESGQRKPR